MRYTLTTRTAILSVEGATAAARKARALGAPGVMVQIRDAGGRLVDLAALAAGVPDSPAPDQSPVRSR